MANNQYSKINYCILWTDAGASCQKLDIVLENKVSFFEVDKKCKLQKMCSKMIFFYEIFLGKFHIIFNNWLWKSGFVLFGNSISVHKIKTDREWKLLRNDPFWPFLLKNIILEHNFCNLHFLSTSKNDTLFSKTMSSFWQLAPGSVHKIQ